MPDIVERDNDLFREYGDELRAGQAALDRRRAEFAFNHPDEGREIVSLHAGIIPHASEVDPRGNQEEGACLEPDDFIKIWPGVLLASVTSHHAGAARLWFLARSLDPGGSGWVAKAGLWEVLKALGVGERKRRRWLKDALALGIMGVRRGKYSYAALEKGAIALGCRQIGLPSTSQPALLFAPAGWRSHVWDAYLATLNARPVSQATKAVLTGIHPRVQRLWQENSQSEVVQNYAPLDLRKDQVAGSQEVTGRHVFVTERGQAVQRLPDIRTVPIQVSRSLKKGRSRKAQRAVNAREVSCPRSREYRHSDYDGTAADRLFCSTRLKVKSTIKALTKDDVAPWDAPVEIFEYLAPSLRGRANIWQAVDWRTVNV